MPIFEHTFRTTAEGVAALGSCAADVAALDNASLLAAQEQLGALRRHTDTIAAWVAAEIAHRSRYELGYAGLAQQKGFLSPEALIQSVTNMSRIEAVKLVSVGTMMAETEAEAALAEAGRVAGDPLSGEESGAIELHDSGSCSALWAESGHGTGEVGCGKWAA